MLCWSHKISSLTRSLLKGDVTHDMQMHFKEALAFYCCNENLSWESAILNGGKPAERDALTLSLLDILMPRTASFHGPT